MKLKTLDELGATNLEGCEALIKKFAPSILGNHEYPEHDGSSWSQGNDFLTALQNRRVRFMRGEYNYEVLVLEKWLEDIEVGVANNGGDVRVGDCSSGHYERFLRYSEELRQVKISAAQKSNDVNMTIAWLHSSDCLDDALELAEAYDMTIYTCKSCNSWHILKNDADPICPDCEYSLDEVL